jgi:GNAT superfamily N-acetyltransferase
VFLGMDATGIGAVTMWTPLDEPGAYLFQILAVARRYRGQGGAHATEAVNMTLSVMEAQAIDLGATELYVAARVHQNNIPSRRLIQATGFEPDESVSEGLADHQGWVFYRELGSP